MTRAHPVTGRMRRRSMLQAGGAALGVLLMPPRLLATPADADAAIAALFGQRAITEARVHVELPEISENGYSVPITVAVDSPMTAADHVVRIALFAEDNPNADIARFELGPQAGLARIETRIRLGGSQRIRAVAEMNDGSLWTGHAYSVVTLAACVL